MRGWATGNEETVTVDELSKRMSDGVASPPDPDGLHHARVPQLAATEFSVKHLKKEINQNEPVLSLRNFSPKAF